MTGPFRQLLGERAHPIVRRAVILLGASLAVLCSLTVLMSNRVLSGLGEREGVSSAVALAARQHTLTHEIAELAELTVEASSSERRRSLTTSLDQTADALATSLGDLIEGEPSAGIPAAPASVRETLLGSADPGVADVTTATEQLVSQVLTFTAAVREGSADEVALGEMVAEIVLDGDVLESRYDNVTRAYIESAENDIGEFRSRYLVLVAVWAVGAVAVALLFYSPLVGRLARELRELDAVKQDQREGMHYLEFDRRVQNGLGMVDDEYEVLDLIDRAVGATAVGATTQILLADSSTAHLSTVRARNEDELAGCAVSSPDRCPAVARGRTLRFDRSDQLDTCPKLQVRGPQGELSACCVPLGFLGTSFGVVHVVRPSTEGVADVSVPELETVAAAASQRIGILRTLDTSQREASIDPLTGLLNRRSFAEQLGRLHRSGDGYSLAMIDLDHFKKLNDGFGHEAGDKALRVFAQVLRSTKRQHDIAGRYGGEEFVLVLPDTPVPAALKLLQRLRANLAITVASGDVAAFTASYGLASGADGVDPDDVIRIADGALLEAKAQGRDRVRIAPRSAAELEEEQVLANTNGRERNGRDPAPTGNDDDSRDVGTGRQG
ncbi:MAG: GGDEF domain-containing protein [Actinomycetota bacterium]|nr:GGDEF domain-containing protein [Actinomycetota bacterium]